MTKGKLIKNLSIKVPVYYRIDEDMNTGRKVIVVDEESMIEEFDQQLDNIMEMFHEQNADAN